MAAEGLLPGYEASCEQFNSEPVEWVKEEVSSADRKPHVLDLRGNCLPERFSARLDDSQIYPIAEVLRSDPEV